MAVVSILAAISLVSFNEFRARAYDSRTVFSVKNARVAQYAFILDNQDRIANLSFGDLEVSNFSGNLERYFNNGFTIFNSYSVEKLLPGYVFDSEIRIYVRLNKQNSRTLQPLIAAVHCKGSTISYDDVEFGTVTKALTAMISDNDSFIHSYNFDPVECL